MKMKIVYAPDGTFGVEVNGKRVKDNDGRLLVGFAHLFVFKYGSLGNEFVAFSEYWNGTVPAGVYYLQPVPVP